MSHESGSHCAGWGEGIGCGGQYMECQFVFCLPLAFCHSITCYTPQEMCLTMRVDIGVEFRRSLAEQYKGSFIGMWMAFNVMRPDELMQVISLDREQQASTRAEPRHKCIYL